jgi:predicted nucleic acid-binding protein
LILYLDTSALVKLYVRERGSSPLRRWIAGAQALATSVVAYAETRAAFARLRQSGTSSIEMHQRRVQKLDADWDAWLRVELLPDVLRSAGDLADSYLLRGFDAIHLASALWLKARAAEAVDFAAFDFRLGDAASNAGFRVFPRPPRVARRERRRARLR